MEASCVDKAGSSIPSNLIAINRSLMSLLVILSLKISCNFNCFSSSDLFSIDESCVAAIFSALSI
jgi:hypothetical protein